MKQALVQCSQCTVDEGLKTVDQPTRGKKEGKGKKKRVETTNKDPQDPRSATLDTEQKREETRQEGRRNAHFYALDC